MEISMIPDERGQGGQRCPAVYPTFGPGARGLRGKGTVVVGNTGVGLRKSEGGTSRAEEGHR